MHVHNSYGTVQPCAPMRPAAFASANVSVIAIIPVLCGCVNEQYASHMRTVLSMNYMYVYTVFVWGELVNVFLKTWFVYKVVINTGVSGSSCAHACHGAVMECADDSTAQVPTIRLV